MSKLLQCMPAFSEGRDSVVMEQILDCFRAKDGVKLLDYNSDPSHNRLVVTAVGEPERLQEVVLKASEVAIDKIDMRCHLGTHPRTGAIDQVSFIPLRHTSMECCIHISKEIGRELADRFALPVYLYDRAASAPHRINLSEIRQVEFEGLEQKMRLADWMPDFGNNAPHPTAGCVAIGARMPVVDFNINLCSDRLDIASDIAKKIRYADGDFRFVSAVGVKRADHRNVQVSIAMTDFTCTALYRVYETVKFEAMRWGVTLSGSEIKGLVPMEALIDTAEYYLGLEDFSTSQVLESRIIEY